MSPPRAWRLLLVCAVVAAGGACSSGSGNSSHGSSTSSSSTSPPPTVTRPTVTRPTVPPPTVTRPTLPPGRVMAVPPSIDPTGRVNVTDALQLFLSRVPSGRTVLFRKNARYRVEGTLFIRHRQHITIDGNGATVFATTRGKPARSQWWIKNGSDIVFRDLIVRGANPHAGTADDAYVRKLETQHGFRFEGVNGAELDHVQVYDTYGDFVYIGRGTDRIPCHNVWVHDSRFARNGRQGISVTAATNVIIERNHFDQTRRSVVDLEPDARSALVSNIFILDNTVGKGRLLFLASHGQGPVDNVVVSGNQLPGHSLTIDSMAPGNTRRTNWVIENNVSNVPVQSRPMRFFGIDGLIVRGNRQIVTGGDPGVVLNNVCGAKVSANDFGSGGVHGATQCNAPISIPKAPALAGRLPGGGIATTLPPSTTSPRTSGSTTTPGSNGSSVPTTTLPASAPGSGGGFDLADGIFVALGALVLAAAVLAIRSRRPRVPHE